MANLIARILLISDFHWLTVPVGKQKGQILQKWYEKLIEKIVIDSWKHWTMLKKLKVLKMLGQYSPYDEVIDSGDFIECEYNERGLVQQSDKRKLAEYLGELKMYLRFLKRIHTAASDHLVGYRLPLHYDSEGGMSQQSLINFQEVIGPLFETFCIEKFRFIILSSLLFTQKFEHKPREDQRYIEELKEKQNQFLQKATAESSSQEIVFLFLHDPDSLEVIDGLLGDGAKKKIARVFCGHLHARWVLEAYRILGKLSESVLMKILAKLRIGKNVQEWSRGNLHRAELFQNYNLEIIPSPTGMMGIGGGFLVLNLYDDGSYEIEKHKM